jgi:membrane peptidoglycan carboxypeptidase
MSDRPVTTDSEKTPSGSDGGWSAPTVSDGWRTPERDEDGGWQAPKAKPPAQGWRVPTLPQNLDVLPAETGDWHLPKPEDTILTPDDKSIVTEAPADSEEAEFILPHDATETDADEIIPFDETPITPVDDVAVSMIDAASDAGIPVEADTEPSPEEAPTNALETLDEDDEDTFSMSELVALASLVDNAPSVPVQSASSVAEQAAPTDPAEYARQQLERLRAGQEPEAQPAVEAQTAQPAAGVADPAEYARQQLERLGGAAQPAVPTAPALTPQEEALAQKYRDAESRIRALRDQYRAGQMTREQLQAELRNQMVLDEDQSWWMMGVETDTWYHYQNGQWVAQKPSVLEKSDVQEQAPVQAVSAPVTVTPEESPGDLTVPTAAVRTAEYDMPLPRQVPVRDPDYTIPGTEALYIERADPNAVTMPIDSGATVPSAAISDVTVPSAAVSSETVPSPAVQAQQYNYVAAPIQPADAPPSYDVAPRPSPVYEDAVKRQRQRTMRTVAIVAAVFAGLIFIVGACGIIGGVMYYQSLVSPYTNQIAALANFQPQFQTARIFAADGSVIAELIGQGAGDRRRVALSEISPYMIHAIISTENERFYDDPGWDAIAIARAFLQNLAAGDVEQGASTITQQIARNLILQDTTVSVERKLQEIVIAAEIAQRYDKNFILELYLNEFFFGNQSYGVEAASLFYFGHSAADLNLPEAAMLAGILQSPAQYDPVVNREAAFDRMDDVLGLMAEAGCLQFQHAPYLGQEFCVSPNDLISGQTALEKAQLEVRNYQPRNFSVRYPHFVNFIQAQLEQNFGTDEIFRRGFQIRTTLNPRLQDTAQTALEQTVGSVRNLGINTGAVFVLDPRDGAIRVMVGSPDFNNEEIDGQVNNVFTWQQPGSSIKPVVYTAGLEGVDRNGVRQYLTPASILWDVPTTYPTTPPYSPTNYDNTFHGPQTVRSALGNSYNIPAVKAFDFIGADRFVETGQRMGLRFLEEAQFGLPSALGANEVRLYDHAQVYATLATDGLRVPPYAIIDITDSEGNPVEIPPRPEPSQAVQPQIAYLMQNILSDNQARAASFGLNSGLALPEYPGLVGAKTGTTNNSTDLWTMGFTNNVVVGVWMGSLNNDRTNATTSNTAIPVWNTVIRAALQGNAPEPFNAPDGITQQQICASTGTLYDPNVTQICPDVRMELFLQNQLPPPAAEAFVRTIPIDTWTGLQANQYCPDNTTTGTFVNISDQSAIQWLNSAQGAAYAQSIGLETPVEQAPTGQCQPGQQLPQVRMSSPTEGQQVQGIVPITGQVQAPNFNRYQIEVATINSPDDFVIVSGPTAAQQPNGTLGQWDTTTVPNGVYRLRLAVFANDGGYIYKVIQIGVNNVAPTPTIAPIIFPTADPGLSTPIPFEQSTPIPFGGLSDLNAPPTPTLDFNS